MPDDEIANPLLYAPPLGLRERKKRQTRAAIAEAAERLFHERGFDSVTMAEVAAAADVSPKTVFNYFSTKEDLAFNGEEHILAMWIHCVRHRRPGTTPTDAVREFVLERFGDDGLFDRLQDFQRLVESSPTLQTRLRLVWERLEAAFTTLLVDDAPTGSAPAGSDPRYDTAVQRVVAAQVVTVIRLLFSPEVRDYVVGYPASQQRAALERWIDAAIGVVGGHGAPTSRP